jgi:hypothetical protein
MSSLSEAVLALLPSSTFAQLLKVAVTVPVVPGESVQITFTVGWLFGPEIWPPEADHVIWQLVKPEGLLTV